MAQTDTGNLFAYGTLLDPSVQLEVLGRAIPRTLPALLHGYAVKKGRWPYLIPAKAETKGMLLLTLTEKDFQALDAYEDVAERLYAREKKHVVLDDGSTMQGWVYFPVLSNWNKEWL